MGSCGKGHRQEKQLNINPKTAEKEMGREWNDGSESVCGGCWSLVAVYAKSGFPFFSVLGPCYIYIA